jgi:hypothetical protein
VRIGSLEVDGFMLPDGSYRMSQTQAAECVGLTERNAREFLDSKAFKSLMGEGYTPAIIEIESEENQLRGQSQFRALPLEVDGLPKYRFHQLIKDEWLLTGQSSSWQAIESKELDLDQQEDLTLGIIVATERSDIPFLRTA